MQLIHDKELGTGLEDTEGRSGALLWGIASSALFSFCTPETMVVAKLSRVPHGDPAFRKYVRSSTAVQMDADGPMLVRLYSAGELSSLIQHVFWDDKVDCVLGRNLSLLSWEDCVENAHVMLGCGLFGTKRYPNRFYMRSVSGHVTDEDIQKALMQCVEETRSAQIDRFENHQRPDHR